MTERSSAVLASLRRLVPHPDVAVLSDSQLLQRFASNRDAAAFTILVERYCRLVHGVCLRLLAHQQDAEDVFQATFLILAQKAATIRCPDSVASWLYGVACRLAHKARARRARTRSFPEVPMAAPEPALSLDEELREVLDRELARLPEQYRSALILCYLQGQSHREAATQLGCSVAALNGRLQRGRELLRQRLVKRGLALTIAAMVAALERQASAAVPAGWVRTTVQAALQFTAGETAGSAVRASALALARDTLPGFAMAKIMLLVAVLLAVGTLAVAAGQPSAEHAGPAAEARAGRDALEGAEAQPGVPALRTDQYGDLLPPGAIQRLGTGRLRNAQGFHALAFSQDSKSLISAGSDQVVSVSGYAWLLQSWEAATGKETQRVAIQGTFMAFSPDGSVAAGYETDKRRIHLWDVATGKELRVLEGEVYYVVSGAGAFSPDRKTFAAAAENSGVLRLWDVATGKEGRSILCERRPDVLLFSPDGKTLATVFPYRTASLLQLWDVASGKQVHAMDVDKTMEPREVTSVAFSPDGTIVAVGWGETVPPAWGVMDNGVKRVTLWDASSGKRLGAFKGVHGFAFAPDGKTLALASEDAFVLADLAGKVINTLAKNPGRVHGIAFAADGKTLAAISGYLIRTWEVPSGKEINTRPGHLRGVTSVAVSPQGKYVASGSFGDLWLWEAATGKAIQQLKGHVASIDAIAFSPDGKYLVSGGENNDGTIRLWDVETGEELRKLKVNDWYGGVGSSLVFSPDGKTIASKVHFWDAASGAQIRHFDFPYGNAVGFSPDGKRLAFGSGNGSVRLWDQTGGKTITEWNANDRLEHANYWQTWFSPDLKAVLVSSGKNHKVVWLCDAATGKVMHEIPLTHWAVSAAFSPDGKTLALAAGTDVHLWDTATGKEIRRLKGHQDYISSVAFSPDGKTLVSASRDNTVLVWEVDR
jgi:RNA polymerase sigma factor (sigma-70 family)